MEGVDKDKVQRIVYEMSKGSKYFQNEERKDAFIRQKIDNLKTQCSKLTQADLSHYQKASHSFSSFTHNSLFQCNCNSFSCLNSSCRRIYQLFFFLNGFLICLIKLKCLYLCLIAYQLTSSVLSKCNTSDVTAFF